MNTSATDRLDALRVDDPRPGGAVRVKVIRNRHEASEASRHGLREVAAAHCEKDGEVIFGSPLGGEFDGRDIGACLLEVASRKGAVETRNSPLGAELLFIMGPAGFPLEPENRREATFEWFGVIEKEMVIRWKDQVAGWRIDLDEATPHISFFVAPVHRDGRSKKNVVSTRKDFGAKRQLSALQDWYHQFMAKAGYDLRPPKRTGLKRENITPAALRRLQAEATEEAVALRDRAAEDLEAITASSREIEARFADLSAEEELATRQMEALDRLKREIDKREAGVNEAEVALEKRSAEIENRAREADLQMNEVRRIESALSAREGKLETSWSAVRNVRGKLEKDERRLSARQQRAARRDRELDEREERLRRSEERQLRAAARFSEILNEALELGLAREMAGRVRKLADDLASFFRSGP